MNKFFKVIIWVLAVLAVIIILGFMAIRYVANGTLGSTSCGPEFEKGFLQAVKDNNPNFCLTFDFNKVNQYRNFKGYYACSAPGVGESGSAGPIIKGSLSSADYCLQAFSNVTKNVEACDLMTLDFEKDVCFLRLAKGTNNTNYCNRISAGDLKNVCLGNDINYVETDQTYAGAITFMDLAATKGPSMILEGFASDRMAFSYALDASKANITDINGNSLSVTSLKVGDKITAFGSRPGDHATIYATKIQKIK